MAPGEASIRMAEPVLNRVQIAPVITCGIDLRSAGVSRAICSRRGSDRAEERMNPTRLAENEWGAIFDHQDLLELRWLPSTSSMTDGGFMATLCLFATEAEKARRPGVFIDAMEFRHKFGAGVMEWRDAHIIPRYGAAGIRRFAFLVPAGFPRAGAEAIEGPAVFPTRWFEDRHTMLAWLRG